MTEVLSANRLTKTYGSHIAVNDVSFTLESGQALGLVGESGSGKTTIARMLMGLEKPSSGEVTFGNDVVGKSAKQRAKHIQMVFQDPYLSLDPRLTATTVVDNVLRLHGLSSKKARKARIAELLDSVNLSPREASTLPRQLSGGQRQRVAIARALAVQPSVLVLDEATSALDVSVQAQILTLLNEIRRESGVAYVFVSHDLAVVREVCDQLLVMYRGLAVEHTTPQRALTEPEHPYTRLLVDSVPRPGWVPSEIAARRRQLAADMGVD